MEIAIPEITIYLLCLWDFNKGLEGPDRELTGREEIQSANEE